jgi:maltose O-acetyltransferase
MEPRSERELMLAGELYLAADPELVAMRRRARALTARYNASSDLDTSEPASTAGGPSREQLLRELLGKVGKHPVIEPPFRCDYGCHIQVGDNLFANFGCIILDCHRVEIGDDVFIAPNVQILAATHPLDPETRASGRELARPVLIESRVWIGAGAILCPGVSIGEGSVIGAGSVVLRDVPARVLAAGNPARVIRSL